MSGAGCESPTPRMGDAARYRIRVRGRLDSDDAARLRGMSIESADDGSGSPVSTLDGELPDQAALLGVLHALNGFHLPLLSVECQPDEDET